MAACPVAAWVAQSRVCRGRCRQCSLIVADVAISIKSLIIDRDELSERKREVERARDKTMNTQRDTSQRGIEKERQQTHIERQNKSDRYRQNMRESER